MTRNFEFSGEVFQGDDGEGGQALRLPVVLDEILAAYLSEGSLRIVSHPHAKIHDGASFTARFTNAVTNINEQTVIAFHAPTNAIHMVITVESDFEANVMLYRDTSIDPDEGTQITPVNRNQTGTPATSLVTSIETTPVVNKMTSFNEGQAATANITTSTLLDTLHLLGGGGPLAVGAAKSGRETEEWEFDGSTQVAIVMNAETADNATHIIRIDFYEGD